MKLVIGFLCLVMSSVFTYIVWMVTRSYFICAGVFSFWVIVLGITWIRDKDADTSFKDYVLGSFGSGKSMTTKAKHKHEPVPEKAKAAPQTKITAKDLEPIVDSIIIAQRIKSVIAVGIKVDAVKDFEKNAPVRKDDVPVYIACKALDVAEEKIARIINSRDAYTIQQIKASERTATSEWGKEKIYYVQINTDYFGGSI